MKNLNLSAVLSSGARFDVLRALSRFRHPLSLRELERASNLAIRSVQVAISGLEEQGVVRRRDELFELNQKNRFVPLLNRIFELIQSHEIEDRVPSYGERPQEVLQFCDELRALIRPK